MARTPPLAALRAFEAVARHGSLKAAAGELAVTPSAVSHQIKALEADLGITLLVRLNRAVQLTEAGRLLSLGLSDGFTRLREAVDRVRPNRGAETLTVSCGPPFAAKWLAPRLGDFLSRFPHVDLRIAANLSRSDLDSGEADVAIRLSREVEQLLYAVDLWPERVTIMASPDAFRRYGVTVRADLVTAPLIHDDSLLFDPDAPTWPAVFRSLGLPPDTAHRGPRFGAYADQALDAAAAGAGFVLGRLVLAERDLSTGRLARLEDQDMPTGVRYRAVCRAGRQKEPTIANFLFWISAA